MVGGAEAAPVGVAKLPSVSAALVASMGMAEAAFVSACFSEGSLRF